MNPQICQDCGCECDPICMTCPECGSYHLEVLDDHHEDEIWDDCTGDYMEDEDGDPDHDCAVSDRLFLHRYFGFDL